MALIGRFKQDEAGYIGAIETLTTAAQIKIVPVAKPSASAPDYRLYRGAGEIGAAWAKAARNGRRYLAVILDDPAYAKPVQARLVAAAGGFALLWDRE